MKLNECWPTGWRRDLRTVMPTFFFGWLSGTRCGWELTCGYSCLQSFEAETVSVTPLS